WKKAADEAARMPEPMETVKTAVASERSFGRFTTVTGTVRALQSIILQNELDGTVSEIRLTPGAIVEAGDTLVALDLSVEQAELKAQEAQAELARVTLGRIEPLSKGQAVAATELDRARAERDMALAQVARIQATMDRKTLRAPFRARVGLSDIHKGQYLEAGTEITTLQGVDDAVHVDFQVPQEVAAIVKPGSAVEIFSSQTSQPVSAKVVALDSRADYDTRNLAVRARVEAAGAAAPSPGAAVRVRVPTGPPVDAVCVPVTSLRRGADGDFVFVLIKDDQGKDRATLRPVKVAALQGEEVYLADGLKSGEKIAAAGSFKLREGVLVGEAPAEGAAPAPSGH
ncbi:MAG: efflux RND transporter periplasmic adaptor subunit, partial [Verrucomicrobiaceae bacterium]